MHSHVDCLGRISVTPRLHPHEVEELADLTTLWAPTRLGMVLRQYCDRDTVVAELRALIDTQFRPMGLVLHGMVVARTADGDLFTVAARNNRVSTRQLWTAADEPAADPCRVIDLDSRRRRQRSSHGEVS